MAEASPSAVLDKIPSIPLGTIGLALLIFFAIIIGLGIIIGGVMWWINERKYKYKIPLLKKVGGRVKRVATYKAKIYPLSKAGDCLWHVKGKGLKKFIPPAMLQTGDNEFLHFERADGEWINIDYDDIDELMKKAGVKYIQQDMRTQRIATQEVLENRFQDKSFWDKYGNIIMHIIFLLIITVQIIITFWMWGNIVDKTSVIMTKMDSLFQKIVEYEKPVDSLIPAMSLLLFFRRTK